MIDNAFIIDAVAHGYWLNPSNIKDPIADKIPCLPRTADS